MVRKMLTGNAAAAWGARLANIDPKPKNLMISLKNPESDTVKGNKFPPTLHHLFNLSIFGRHSL